MSQPGNKNHFRSLIVALALGTAFAGAGAVTLAQDAGAPPWGEFLRRFEKDPLLKKPYHMDPEEGVKGLASKIRARELDIPNRKRAIRYLGELDCTQFPEAKEMLLSMLDPEVEKWEEVRFEAAKNLRDMLARHSCNPNAANGSGNRKNGSNRSSGNQCNSCKQPESFWQQCRTAASSVTKKARGKQEEPEVPCHCRSCCDADTLTILAKTAYELKEDGCCYEPSRRVREMAVEAIRACGVPCNFGPYYAEEGEPGPPPTEEGKTRDGRVREVVPPPSLESVPSGDPGDSVREIRFPANPALTLAPTPIPRLATMCIVSLHAGRQVPSQEEFSATYRGRIYYFSSLETLARFRATPEQYAVAFGGCDPVHYVDTREAVEGRYLTQHEGRFFMFASRQNHERFIADPARYSGDAGRSAAVASAR